ncbi:MAG: PHP domain-containing protein [Candidatus Nealsonbacteria bacterium]|nr:PHP domain-containing protein [Candidatus Nealsonbacteria bacterium]
MHSYYSDGSLSPSVLVQKCKDKGLEIISLTDHENTGGIPEAQEAGSKSGIKVIPGIEFSVDYQGDEHHILGHFIDYRSQQLWDFLEAWKKTKIEQVEKIINNLKRFGFEVSLEDVLAKTKGSLDRIHISSVMFPDWEKIPELAEKQKIFFRKYLLEPPTGQGMAYAAREKPDIRPVIDLIHKTGGIACWAHPFWKNKDVKKTGELAAIFKSFGLDCIEVIYPFHDQGQTVALHKIAQNLSMYESAGSDFHREDLSSRQIASFQTFGIEINFPFEK